jgi:hypothetical protein
MLRYAPLPDVHHRLGFVAQHQVPPSQGGDAEDEEHERARGGPAVRRSEADVAEHRRETAAEDDGPGEVDRARCPER